MARGQRFCTCSKRTRDMVKTHVQDYCGATTIHGVQYLAEARRPITERLWWVIVFIASFCVNSYMISKIWEKWHETPVIVSFDEKTTPVWEVPFPAITICPEARFDAHALNFSHLYSSQNLTQGLADAAMLCEYYSVSPGIPDWLAEDNEFTSDNVTDYFSEIDLDKSDMIHTITWRNQKMDKNDYISEILTENGYCYNFNMVDPSEMFIDESDIESPQETWFPVGWSPDKGYPKDWSVAGSYPFRVANSGLKESFRIILLSNISVHDHACHGPWMGFKVTIHHPGQIPHVNDKYFRVPIGKEVMVGVVPDIMKTSDTLASYPPADRQCYFSHERQLAFFKIYSQHNCEFECLTNMTIYYCECVAFYMPRLNSSIPICGIGQWDCVYMAKMNMNNALVENVPPDHGGSPENTEKFYSCQCLPSCSTIKYNTDVSQSNFRIQDVLVPNENITEDDLKNLHASVLQVYFFDKYFTTSKRSELYGHVDFIANAGGLLSLFSGLSFLSIIEIFYWLTLRCFNTFKRHYMEEEQREDESGEELEEVSPLKTKEV